MTDQNEIIERLKQQNNQADTTDAQREANKWRISFLEALHQEKPQTSPTNATDILLEAHKQSNYRCTPRSLL